MSQFMGRALLLLILLRHLRVWMRRKLDGFAPAWRCLQLALEASRILFLESFRFCISGGFTTLFGFSNWDRHII